MEDVSIDIGMDVSYHIMLKNTMIYCLNSVFYVGDKRVRYDCSAISGPLDMLAGLAENNWLEALEFV